MKTNILIFNFLILYICTFLFVPSQIIGTDIQLNKQSTINYNERPFFNVMDFGAAGDCINDDSEAFKISIREAGKNKGIVFIPPGEYLITDILIPESGIIVQGVGIKSKIYFRYPAFSESKQLYYGWHFTDQKNVVFKNFAMDGGSKNFDSNPVAADGAHFLIYFNPIYNNAVENISIVECHFSGSFDSAIQSYGRAADRYPHPLTNDIKIDKCYFHDVGSHGIGMNEWSNSSVTNCSFINMGKRKMINGYGSGMAVDVSGGSRNIIISNNFVDNSAAGFKAESHQNENSIIASENIIIANNIITNCKEGPGFDVWYGIRVNGKNVTVQGNIIDSNLHGILVAPLADKAIIEGNQILSTKHKSAVGIRVDAGLGNHTVTGNIIYNAAAQGILVTCNSVIVTNNQVSNCQLDGIRIADVNGVVCTQNIFKNNKGQGISIAPINKDVNNVIIANNLNFDDRELQTRTQQRGIFVSKERTTNVQLSDNLSFNNTISQEVQHNRIIHLNSKTEKSYKMSSAPKSGIWKLGDIVYNSKPKVNNYIGWICIEAGNPGVWKPFGFIEP